jgi:hypothetical protein
MRAAACVIAAHWKGLATRRYVRRYRAAVAVTRKFIIGFMNRNKPKCEQNIYVSEKINNVNIPSVCRGMCVPCSKQVAEF